MHNLNSNYHDCKLTVKAVVPGSLPSFLYAYCKTVGVPAHLEPAFIRKAVPFAKLSRHVAQHITNDFSGWYRANEDSQTLFDVLATIINTADCRTDYYRAGKPLVSAPFRMCGIDIVLVQKFN